MKNKNTKKITKLFLFLILGITSINKVQAKLYEEETIDKSIGTSAYNAYMSKNNNETDRIVVCAYESSEEDSNIITYSIDNTKKDKWTISALTKDEDYNTLYNWNGLRNTLPPVYFEGYEKDRQETWNKDLKAYEDLQKNFKCPSHVYIEKVQLVNKPQDIKSMLANANQETELCYENKLGTCATRNTIDSEIITDTESNEIYFSTVSTKTYTLNEELFKVLNEASDIISSTDESTLIKPMLNLEATADSDKICKLMTSGEFENIAEDTSGNNNYREYLDNTFKTAYEYAHQKGLGEYNYNINLYNYENLSKLFIGEKDLNIMYDEIELNQNFELIQKVYTNRIGQAYSYYKDYCSKTTGKEIKEKREKIEQNVLKSLKNMSKNSALGGTLNCDSIFSDFATEIKTVYFFIEILSIVLVVALSALEYAKIIMNDNQDEFKKANKKLARRIIILVTLFLLPAILNMVLGLFSIEGFNSENPLCINVTEK